MKHTLLAASAWACILAMPASAATTFNLGGGSNTLNTIALSEDGINLTVSGYSSFNGTFTGGTPNGTLTNINRNDLGNGWGVNLGGSGLIDVGDALHFDFSPLDLQLQSLVLFESDANADDIQVFADGSLISTLNIPADPGADTQMFSFHNLTGATTFTFAAQTGAFRVKSLTVDEIAPIPLPAAGFMMIAGLAGLAGLRRRRDKHQG